MDTVKFVPMLVGLLLAVVMVGAVFVPVISSSTTRTITTEIDNEGAGWLSLGYNEGTDYSFSVGFDEGDNFNVGTQTGEYTNMICYADPQRTLFVSGDNWYLLTNGETPSVHKFTENASVTNASGTLTILDGSETVYTGASPTWAYVPDANGVYGFFTEGGLNLEEGKPKVAVGSYAGVFAYNDTVVAPGDLGTLGLTMSGDYADGEVIWMVAPSELDTLSALPTDTLEPAVLDLEPVSLDPIDLGESGSVGLMTADPSGTQIGDLYYSFNGNNATVKGYSSSIDWSTFTAIPETVSYNGVTYTVTEIGDNAFQNCTSLTLTSLPDTIRYIYSYAFDGCTNLALTSLPEGLISTGLSSFRNCTSLALTSLPEGMTTLNNNLFNGCTNLALTSLPEGLTSVGNSVFANCTSLALTSLPEGLTSVGTSSFRNCTSLALTSLPEGLTSVGSKAFEGCTNLDNMIVLGTTTFSSDSFNNTNIKEVLNFGETEITPTSFGLNAESVQDHVTALGYIAPTSIHETEVIPIDSPVASLMQLLPLIAGIGALFLAVGTLIYTRF